MPCQAPSSSRDWLVSSSKAVLDLARPILRILPRGAGWLYRLLGGERSSSAWAGYGLKATRGTDHGFLMHLDLGDPFEREAYYLGRFYEWELQSLISMVVRRGDTFIDVGANIGMITLCGAAAVGPQGQVLAFEPNPEPRARLMEHVQSNNLSQVRVFHQALSVSQGSATLATPERRSGTGTLRQLHGGGERTFQVEVKRLDDFLEELRPGARIFLKIDTEGFDFNVLQGAPRLLSRPGVMVFSEVHHGWLGEIGQTAEEMFGYMRDLGYGAYLPRLQKGFGRPRVRLEPLNLPGPHHWFNTVFMRYEDWTKFNATTLVASR